MSVQTLYTAATGMDALETKLDVIANNLANVKTTGFKKDRANFEDLLYRTEVYPGVQDSTGTPTAVGTQVGLGVRVTSTQTDQRQGAFQQTGRDLDIAIEGRGYCLSRILQAKPLFILALETSISMRTVNSSLARHKPVVYSIRRSPFQTMRPRS